MIFPSYSRTECNAKMCKYVKYKFGWVSVTNFFEKIIYFAFVILKFTNHCFPQLLIELRSSFKSLISVSVLSLVSALHRAVSSAKRKLSVCKFLSYH